jgi:hypothetical protein
VAEWDEEAWERYSCVEEAEREAITATCQAWGVSRDLSRNSPGDRERLDRLLASTSATKWASASASTWDSMLGTKTHVS